MIAFYSIVENNAAYCNTARLHLANHHGIDLTEEVARSEGRLFTVRLGRRTVFFYNDNIAWLCLDFGPRFTAFNE